MLHTTASWNFYEVRELPTDGCYDNKHILLIGIFWTKNRGKGGIRVSSLLQRHTVRRKPIEDLLRSLVVSHLVALEDLWKSGVSLYLLYQLDR